MKWNSSIEVTFQSKREKNLIESHCSPSCGQCESQWRLPIPEISVTRPIHIMIATICGWYVSGYESLFVSGGSEVWYLRLEFDEFHWDSKWPHEGVKCFCVSKNLQMRSICLVKLMKVLTYDHLILELILDSRLERIVSRRHNFCH